MRDDGTLWLNLGDSYASSPPGNKATGLEKWATSGLHGAVTSAKYAETLDRSAGQKRNTVVGNLKPKDLCGIPWRVALALQADGWWLRSDIIWSKNNPMPESVTDRPTKSHEYLFLLTPKARYFYDAEAIKESGAGRETWFGDCGYSEASGRNDGDGRQANSTPAMRRNARTVWTIPTSPFSGWTQTYRLDRVEPGDVSDDTMRITSPDCPVHAGLPDRVPTALRDGHADDLLTHTLRTHGRHVPEQADGSALLDWLRAHCSAHDSSGSPAPPCSPTATPRSSQSRRTDLALETSPACMPCGETTSRTGHTQGESASLDSADRTSESSSASAGSSDCHGPQSACRNGYTSGSSVCKASGVSPTCLCALYQRTTEKTSHFATFPPELARRCIAAGTSEKGCCPECGAPWRRVVEKGALEATGQRGQQAYHPRKHDNTGLVMATNRNDDGHRPGMAYSSKTLGWQPTCKCGGEPVPCVVLDPFAGAGTTCLVAQRLGRDYIGIELSESYAEMARTRIRDDAPLFAER